MEELTREICEGKIRYWEKKLNELKRKEEEKEEKASKKWADVVYMITSGKTYKEVKELINKQINE